MAEPALPAWSVVLTVKVCGPGVDVSIAAPGATDPSHVAHPIRCRRRTSTMTSRPGASEYCAPSAGVLIVIAGAVVSLGGGGSNDAWNDITATIPSFVDSPMPGGNDGFVGDQSKPLGCRGSPSAVNACGRSLLNVISVCSPGSLLAST